MGVLCGSNAPNASSKGGRRECVTMFSIRKAKSAIEPRTVKEIQGLLSKMGF
jgi:hypothetical protein